MHALAVRSAAHRIVPEKQYLHETVRDAHLDPSVLQARPLREGLKQLAGYLGDLYVLHVQQLNRRGEDDGGDRKVEVHMAGDVAENLPGTEDEVLRGAGLRSGIPWAL